MFCANCSGMIEDDSSFCKYCGEGVREPQEVDTSSERMLSCPRCSVAMAKYDYGGFLLDVCRRCGGQWVDTEELQRLLAVEKRQLSREDMVNLRRNWRPRIREQKTTYLKCPRCSSMMRRKNFAQVSGVIIDECRDHGVWYDKGELEAINDFIMKGGLSLGRFRREQRMKQEVGSERRRASAVTARARRNAVRYYGWGMF